MRNATVVDQNFSIGLRRLREFRREFGHCRVRIGYQDASGYHLYNWLRTQRQKMARQTISSCGRKKLEALGVTGSVLDEVYSEHVAMLVKARDLTGTANIPAAYQLEGYHLGQWLAQAKYRARRGRVPSKWVGILAEMGIPLERRKTRPARSRTGISQKERFDRGIRSLATFIEEFGHAHPDAEYVSNGFNLGCWFHHQLRNWRKGTLTNSRMEILSSMGVTLRPAKLTNGQAVLRT